MPAIKMVRTAPHRHAPPRAPIRRRSFLYGVTVTTIIMVVPACSDGGRTDRVDFSQRAPIAKPEQQSPADHSLRVAIGAMISPQQTFAYYHQLLDHIGQRTERPITMIQRKTYGEINRMLGAGQIDMAFICSGPYTSGKKEFGFEALAVPIVRGEPFYRSYLIVHRDSRLQDLEDLRDKVFAFTDPESNSGKLVPTFWLQQMDQRPETFFRKTIYSYSHDNAILAVSRFLVDGAAVHSQVWDYLNLRHPEMTAKTRIIKQSRQFGNPPMVVSRHLDPATRNRIQATLLEMHQRADGRGILDELMIDRFAPPREEWYDALIEMQNCL